MSELFAQPVNPELKGFYFDSVEGFAEQAQRLRSVPGRQGEAFNISFNHGHALDKALFDAVNVEENSLPAYFRAVKAWSEDEKIRAVIALRKDRCPFDWHTTPEEFRVFYHEKEDLYDLASDYIREGYFRDHGEPANVQSAAWELMQGFREIDIAGRRYLYRCG